MAEFLNVLEMAHQIANLIWKRSVQQNVASAVAADVSASNILQKLGISWVPNHAPAFYLNSKNVQIMFDPKLFYRLLLEQIEKANNRIVLSSLYLGTGILEENLVMAIKKKLSQKPDVRVKLLMDCTRGSRGEINSRKMVLPLLESFEKSCQVSLYQTAHLQGPLIPFLPTKYKEVAGLQHIKIYLFDNNFIITGANLSTDYFTNRQDRYMLVKDAKDLCDFIEGLVDKISEFSFRLNPDDSLELGNEWMHDPSKTSPKTFNFAASTSIVNYYQSFLNRSKETSDTDTVIFPLLEMGPFGIHVDSTVTTKLLEQCEPESSVHLTTGYFNLTESYRNTIIEKSQARFKILMAHPTVNGFYKSNFPTGGIPHAYTYLASQFWDKIVREHQGHRIRMFEYVRPKWTYHAKGLWFSTPDYELPFITMIGSPNFGERSVKHDLECQFLMATTDEKLQRDLLEERQSLFDSSIIFTENSRREPDRKVPAWVKVVVFLFRSYL